MWCYANFSFDPCRRSQKLVWNLSSQNSQLVFTVIQKIYGPVLGLRYQEKASQAFVHYQTGTWGDYGKYVQCFHEEVQLTKNLVEETTIEALYQGIRGGELTTLFKFRRPKTYLSAYHLLL